MGANYLVMDINIAYSMLVKSGASSAIVQLNRDIEEKIYNLEPLDRKEIIKILKKEIK